MFNKDSNNRKLSKEQIEFFKDTKVLDDKGNLLVCYHGTRAHFDSFKQTGIFNWFTPDEDYSDYFGDNHYEVYVNIKNPLFLGDIDDLVETEDEIEDESQIVKYDGDKYYLTTTILDIARNLDVPIEELLDIYFDNSNYNTNIYKITKTKEFFSLVEEKGYDGVFAYESGTPTFGTMYANQVKRVANLNPTTNSKMNEDLTPEQQEYFKDSKVRDKEGNLLVCYHGTPTPGFKEFNPTNSDSQFGKYKFSNYNVNYFTTDKKSASSYTEFGYDDGSNVYACYVNIVNPYIVNNKTEAGMRNSFNIKDGRLRKHQIDLFNKIFKKWNEKVTWEYDSEDDFDYCELYELNDDLRTLNLELRPDGDYYSLYTLGNNSFWGAEHSVEPQYTIMELFDDDMYEQLYEDIIGTEEDDYVFTTDDVVKYVLSLNKNEGTNYDGIIIPDIVDSKEMFSFAGTDIITLKSSNQIKKIDNLNPTSSNRIDEESNKKSITLFRDAPVTNNSKIGFFFYADKDLGYELWNEDDKIYKYKLSKNANIYECKTSEQFIKDNNISFEDKEDKIGWTSNNNLKQQLVYETLKDKYDGVHYIEEEGDYYNDNPDWKNGQYQIWNLDVLKGFKETLENLDEDYQQELKNYYDEELFRQIDSINKFLGEYGFEVELVTDEDCLQELVDEDAAGMFFSSIQDNASVFPIGLNKKMICDESENTTDVYYGIVGTLSHEVGHGIFRYCNDILDLDDLDEEEVVEEFARDYEDKFLEQNELMNILKQAQEENIEESLQESKADIEKFRQWAGDELATKFFKLKDRIKNKDIYYWMKQSKEYLSKYLDELEKVPTKREINQKGKEGAEKIYEDDEWRVYKILSYEGAVKYGKNTQWCLSGSNLNTNELSGRDYFDRYSENDIYFYINKKNNRKYALVVKGTYWTLYDDEDWEQVGSWMGYGKIDSWNPYEASKPHFPDIKGLPDVNAEYDYAEREIKQQYGESYLEESREDFFKDSIVKDAQGNLIKVYHGSPFEFKEKKFDSYTNWFSESEKYSKLYGVTKEYYLNCKKCFDCGNTDKFAFNSLKVTKPYICNAEWRKIITDLNLSADEQIKLYKDVLQEKKSAGVINNSDDANLYLYKIRLYSIVNTKAFAELVKSRGYDSIKTLEDGNICYGVFNANQVKSVDNENPTEKDEFDENLIDSEDENVAKLYDESITDLCAFYKLRDL